MKKIAIIGDYNSNCKSHTTIPESIAHAAEKIIKKVDFQWLVSDDPAISRNHLKEYSGFWIAPGSPYRNINNVLEVIRFTRENQIPTLGTCAGFQYMVIEFARNRLGMGDADSEENNPNSGNLVISRLPHSLMNQSENLTVIFDGMKIYEVLKNYHLIGKYECNYGFNQDYKKVLEQTDLKPVIANENQIIRAFELNNHPFFFGTLFLPQLDSTAQCPHPIIQAFVQSLF